MFGVFKILKFKAEKEQKKNPCKYSEIFVHSKLILSIRYCI